MNALLTDTVHVQFKKVKDGEIRNMYCTLVESLIPEAAKPKSSASLTDAIEEQNKNESVIRVYDLEVEGWRSFRVDSVIEYRGKKQEV